MFPYEASEWSDLFVATAGAAAALAGLVFVAVSINLERILGLRGVPERALQTVLMLGIVVVVSILALIPGQSRVALGVELLVVVLGFVGGLAATARASLPSREQPRAWLVSRVGVLAIGALPLLVGALSVLAGTGGGLYWIVGGILGAIVGGIANALVLMVEILR